jgi:serine/threonine protein kinase
MHCDVKPDNFFVNFDADGNSEVVKIADFGLSSKLKDGHKKKGVGGTRSFSAPEVLSRSACDMKVRTHLFCWFYLHVFALHCDNYGYHTGGRLQLRDHHVRDCFLKKKKFKATSGS